MQDTRWQNSDLLTHGYLLFIYIAGPTAASMQWVLDWSLDVTGATAPGSSGDVTSWPQGNASGASWFRPPGFALLPSRKTWKEANIEQESVFFEEFFEKKCSKVAKLVWSWDLLVLLAGREKENQCSDAQKTELSISQQAQERSQAGQLHNPVLKNDFFLGVARCSYEMPSSVHLYTLTEPRFPRIHVGMLGVMQAAIQDVIGAAV